MTIIVEATPGGHSLPPSSNTSGQRSVGTDISIDDKSPGIAFTTAAVENKMLSYRRETALQSAL